MARFSTEAPIVETEKKFYCEKIIISCLALLALMILVYCVTSNQTGIHSLSDYACTELESNTIYKADDLTVVSRFAVNTREAGANVTDYYLTVFHDRNDCPVAAVLSVDDNDDIYARLSEYILGKDQNIGDCFVRGYVKTGGSLANLNYELRKYYNEALAAYGNALGEPVASLEYMLVYYCNGYSDPLIQYLV